jgi:hypothetical protein
MENVRRYITFALVIFSLVLAGCKSSRFLLGELNYDSNFPYKIEYPREIKVSQDIAITADSGLVVLHIYPDVASGRHKINIAAASLFNGENNIIRYVNPSMSPIEKTEYPKAIQPFFNFFISRIELFEITLILENKSSGNEFFRVPMRLSPAQ